MAKCTLEFQVQSVEKILFRRAESTLKDIANDIGFGLFLKNRHWKCAA